MQNMEYIYSLRKYILVITGLFIVSLMAGFLAAVKNPALSENYLEMLKQSFGWIKGLPPLEIMLLIFLNNAFKSLLALVLGVGLGVVPIVFVAGNGMVLGLLAELVSTQKGALFVLASLLPHGIVEVPAILISSGIGLRLGYMMYLSIRGVNTGIKQELRQGIVFYIRVVLPMVLAAAIVETFVTPLIAMQVS